MRNLLLVALLIALATVVACQPKESKPTESSMNSTEQPMENMQKSPESMQDPAAAAQSPESADSGDAAGAAQ